MPDNAPDQRKTRSIENEHTLIVYVNGKNTLKFSKTLAYQIVTAVC